MRTLAALLALMSAAATVATAAPAAAAPPKPKIAALILKTGAVDEDLADNLTEVLIGRIARRGDHEIAGKEEIKSKLGVDERAAADCMQNAGCLGRAGTELGVTRMVVGTLGKRGTDYLYNLSLIDITTGKVENRVFELVAGGKVDQLIAAVQSTADKLLEPKVEPGAVRIVSETRGAMVYLDEAFVGSSPVRREGIEPGQHRLRVEKEGHLGWAKDIDVPAGSTLQINVPLTALPERRQLPGRLMIGTLTIGAILTVVGAVFFILATNAPGSSATRREALDSAELRFVEGRTGVGLLGGGGGLIAIGAGIAIAYRRDIFGGQTRVEAAK
jgi:PEGA domain